ncbi:hypothetical protein GCM10009554_23690 [Kribbella koreensis]|uniref:SnoaL-like domain-containing protein n=1 Tax=Kribbella koreensis TaxID=57909 RepID=A0ABN1Q221_9ACTN
MSSREAIKTLILRYAELVDAGDFEALGALLANAAFTGTTSVTGAAAITQNFNNTVIRYPDGTPRTRHIVTNFLIEVDEPSGTATSRSTFTAYQALPDFPSNP